MRELALVELTVRLAGQQYVRVQDFGHVSCLIIEPSNCIVQLGPSPADAPLELRLKPGARSGPGTAHRANILPIDGRTEVKSGLQRNLRVRLCLARLAPPAHHGSHRVLPRRTACA